MIDFDASVLAAVGAAFGEVVEYLPAGGSPVSITAIFDERFAEQKFKDGLMEVEVKPQIGVRLSTLAAPPAQGDFVSLRGRLYLVAEPPEFDGFGEARLFLRLADDEQAQIVPAAPVAP
ncbi:MAG: hypothetical protein KGH75_01085 [Rhodospirillales bacterium]|nr:hypothetical protein [Rhodospirillales bacterium]